MYVKNPDTQPGKKGTANFNAIENQGIGNGVIPFYGTGKFLVPMKNVSVGAKGNGIIGAEKAAKIDISHRAGVSSALDTVSAAPSSQSYLLEIGLASPRPIYNILDYNSDNVDKVIVYNHDEVWYKFTTPVVMGSLSVDIVPQIDGTNIDDVNLITDNRMNVFVGTDTHLTPVAWSSQIGNLGGNFIGVSNTVYYLRIVSLPSGLLNIGVTDN